MTLNRHLRVLNIEDSEPDSFLLRRHLERAGYEIVMHRAATAEAMRAALREQRWDVILADYTLPQFDSLQALSVLKETGLDIPFIIISGAIAEELAVNAMFAGADDYLMKDNLARLAPAIERELQKISCRSARRQTHEGLKASEAELSAVFTAMTDLIMERQLIVQSLKRTNGNKKLAAKLLSLKRTTLIEKIKRIGLEEPVSTSV